MVLLFIISSNIFNQSGEKVGFFDKLILDKERFLARKNMIRLDDQAIFLREKIFGISS